MRIYRSPLLLRWLFPSAIWKGDDKRAVYLTFDDGPSEALTPWILQTLKKAEVKATFFCVGNNVKKHPELFQQIQEEGHRVGNHTMHHENGMKTRANDYLQSVDEANSFIQSPLFRPPYGKITLKQYFQLKKRNIQIVFWSWLSYDFDPNQASEKVKMKAKSIKGGDILVFHDNPKSAETLTESLEEVIQLLNQKRLTFKTI